MQTQAPVQTQATRTHPAAYRRSNRVPHRAEHRFQNHLDRPLLAAEPLQASLSGFLASGGLARARCVSVPVEPVLVENELCRAFLRPAVGLLCPGCLPHVGSSNPHPSIPSMSSMSSHRAQGKTRPRRDPAGEILALPVHGHPGHVHPEHMYPVCAELSRLPRPVHHPGQSGLPLHRHGAWRVRAWPVLGPVRVGRQRCAVQQILPQVALIAEFVRARH